MLIDAGTPACADKAIDYSEDAASVEGSAIVSSSSPMAQRALKPPSAVGTQPHLQHTAAAAQTHNSEYPAYTSGDTSLL